MIEKPLEPKSAEKWGWVIIGMIVLMKLSLHLLTANQYGYFIDELYTVACGEHFWKGLVDIPPLVPILSWISGYTLGYSLFAIHILPAFAGAATVYIASLIARELGGGKLSQALTALCVALGPVWLAFNAMMAYDGFDQFFSLLFFLFIIRLIRTGNAKYWIVIGLLAGVSLMTKYTMLFIGLALFIALILSKERKHFSSPFLYIGGILCGLIVLPWILWEFKAGWPLLEYWSYYARFRTYHATPLEFFLMLILTFNPLVFPLWLSGFYYFFSHPEGKNYRLLGWTSVLFTAILMVTKAKFYMVASILPMLIAGGSILLERYFISGRLKIIRIAYIILIIAVGIAIIPNGLPVFSPENQARYFSGANFINRNVKTDNAKTAELPQIFADRFGWEERVQAVADVYNTLTPEEKQKCMIYAGDYGNAGAIDIIGKKYGLPKAVCSHLSYFLWGYGNNTGEITITINIPGSKLTGMFQEIKLMKTLKMDYVMPWENNTPIYLCKKPRYPIEKIWPQTKHYD